MPKLKPFRQYDEVNVLNFYRYSGSNDVNNGTFVRLVTGWNPDDSNLAYSSNNGATYGNTVSPRWTVKAACTAAQSGQQVIGMTLLDVKEVDENGESLLFKPRKADEMQAVRSGEAVPIATKGIFLYSGINGTPLGTGDTAYLNNAATDGSISTAGTISVGKFLGPKNVYGCALIYIDL